MAKDRLQKILAHAGVASRRAAEEMIRQGRVGVNGKTVTQLGVKADPTRQSITVDGKPIASKETKEYWLLNKPVGYVSTVRDPQGRPLIGDLLPEQARGRLYPVGRLDIDSEGLVLMTNDGDLAHRLMHPSYGVAKIYRVWLGGRPTAGQLEAVRTGVEYEGVQYAPAQVTIKSATPKQAKVHMELREGRKREIRYIWRALGLRVTKLVRVGMGPLRLEDLPVGAARRLRRDELSKLKRAVQTLSGCKPSSHGVQKSPRQGAKPIRKKT